jgi:hypothetical protein
MRSFNSNDGSATIHSISVVILAVKAILIVPAPMVINLFLHTAGGLLVLQQLTQEAVPQAILTTFIIFTVLPFCMKFAAVLRSILRKPIGMDLMFDSIRFTFTVNSHRRNA